MDGCGESELRCRRAATIYREQRAHEESSSDEQNSDTTKTIVLEWKSR